MKKEMFEIRLSVLAIFLLVVVNTAYSQSTYRPDQLGIKLNHGKIDYDYMKSHAIDTLILGNFNYEDEYSDAAVLYKSKGEIVIYTNLRNGLLGEYKRIKEPDCYKIMSSEQKNAKYFPRPKDEIIIYNAIKSNRIMNVMEINKNKNESQANVRVPQWDIFSDARAFVYDFSFNQVWQSYRSGEPGCPIPLGDIDNDGKNEAIFTFYPINDTFPQSKPTHITVFECYGDNQYRIDWDTLLVEGGEVRMSGIYDFDKNGKKEFFAYSHDWWGNFTNGVFECSGPGKYRFLKTGIDNMGNWWDLCYLDSTGFRTSYPVDTLRNHRGFLGLWGFSGGTSNITGLTYFSKDTTYGGRLFSFIEWGSGGIQTHFQIFDIEFADIDKDGKREIVIGDTQFETNFLDYLDSTGGGPSWQSGWEVKTIIPNAPISAGFMTLKDYDNDGYKEITMCGIGNLSGSIGTVKHTGAPGENQFTTVYWDSVGIDAGPNMFIDTGTINNKFVILYPYDFRRNFADYYHFMTYSLNGIYDFYRSSYKKIDSGGTTRSYLFDMDKDNKLSIIAPMTYMRYFSGNSFLTDFESNTAIGINNNNTEVPKDFMLYQNYPNPFNPSTKIKFEIPPSLSFPKASIGNPVLLIVYDITGRQIQTLVNEPLKPGVYEKTFDGSKLSSGIYFYSLIVDGKSIAVKKMVMVK